MSPSASGAKPPPPGPAEPSLAVLSLSGAQRSEQLVLLEQQRRVADHGKGQRRALGNL